jgi:hypothetical protein
MTVLYRYIRQNCSIYLVLSRWIVTTALFPNLFLFHKGTPKIIINILGHLQPCKRIEARTNLIPGSAIQILNYCKFPVLPISGQNFLRYFEGNFCSISKILSIYLLHIFSWNPWRCSAEPWLGNTDLYWCSASRLQVSCSQRRLPRRQASL